LLLELREQRNLARFLLAATAAAAAVTTSAVVGGKDCANQLVLRQRQHADHAVVNRVFVLHQKALALILHLACIVLDNEVVRRLA
jgi:cobalamin biosynthesis protein CbiG